MIRLRPAAERGHAHHGWLDTWHSFSFADYHDPAHVHWGPLRVINDDRVAPGRGFNTHGHRDMEIITYVLSGTLAHRDSMGNHSRIVPGEVQRLSAGSGITHSEFNHSSIDPVHLLQIWIIPDQQGAAPGYAQVAFPDGEKRGRLRLVASPDGAEGSVSIRQDARLHAGLFDGDEQAALALAPGRLGYVHLARGELEVNGQRLVAGDGLALADEAEIRVGGGRGAEVLVFDLPVLPG